MIILVFLLFTSLTVETVVIFYSVLLAVITRPPDGVLLLARRLRHLASLLKL